MCSQQSPWKLCQNIQQCRTILVVGQRTDLFCGGMYGSFRELENKDCTISNSRAVMAKGLIFCNVRAPCQGILLADISISPENKCSGYLRSRIYDACLPSIVVSKTIICGSKETKMKNFGTHISQDYLKGICKLMNSSPLVCQTHVMVSWHEYTPRITDPLHGK